MPDQPTNDEIADQYDQAWQEGRPTLQQFLQRQHEREQAALLKLLLPIDIEYRKRAGENVDAEDYLDVSTDAVEVARRVMEQVAIDLTREPGSSEPPVDHGATFDPPPNRVSFSQSRQIGPYKLLQKIGEGGMGSVWMAEQEKPVRRRVAVKLIKAGIDNRQVLARFEAERQALAMMNHENIARILDAGTTDSGQPYFVMELVQGIPFNKYCDENQMSVDDRLKLFIPVCKAIQHAHQKGIIHRDLKPSNVLVCLYDGVPVPKVIDFGLAKALQHQTKLTDKTMFTEFGQVVGTLQYMSPEQAEMNQLDIDTRTDIYSLGVMLYELLAGSTPIESDTLQQQAIFKVLESIREKEPPRPSIRLSSSTNEAVTDISKRRQISTNKLKDILQGDLDWIVMKAIEKNRSRRYETANDFAEDIDRYLDGDIVEARPPSLGYKFSKFIAKNKAFVAATAAIMALLVAGIVGTSFGLVRAEAEAKRANEEKLKAIASERDAQNAKKFAEEQTEIATSEKQRAEEAQQAAEAEARKVLAAQEKNEATLAQSNYLLSEFRWKEGRAKLANEHLMSVPPKYRNIEWDISRNEFQGSDITEFLGPADFALSPDGKWIAIAEGPEISIRAAATLTKIKWQESLPKSRATCVAFSPDGKRIAIGTHGGIVFVYAASTGMLGRTFELKGDESFLQDLSCCAVHQLAFSPDGKHLVIRQDHSINVFLLEDGSQYELKPPEALRFRSHQFSNFVIHPNGSLFAAVENSFCWMWELATAKLLKTIVLDINPLGLSLNPDGSVLACTHSSKVVLIDTDNGSTIRSIYGPAVSSRFSPDGTELLTTDSSGTLRWYAWRNEDKLIRKRYGHTDRVRRAKYTSDGRSVFTFGQDGALKVWSLDDQVIGQPRSIAPVNSHGASSGDAMLNIDGIAWISENKFVGLDRSRDRIVIRNLSGSYKKSLYQDRKSSCVAASRESNLFSVGTAEGEVVLIDSKTGTPITSLSCPTSILEKSFNKNANSKSLQRSKETDTKGNKGYPVHHMDVSNDGKILLCEYGLRISRKNGETDFSDKTICVWNVDTSSVQSTVYVASSSSTEPCSCMSFDGKVFATISDFDDIKIHETLSGKVLASFSPHNPRAFDLTLDAVSLIQFSNNSARLWLTVGGSLKAIDVKDAPTVAKSIRIGVIEDVAILEDTNRLFVLKDDKIRIWDIANGLELKTIESTGIDIKLLAINEKQGEIFAIGTGAGLPRSLFCLDLRANLRETQFGIGVIRWAFGPNSELLATQSKDGVIEIWDLESGDLLQTIEGFSGRVDGIVFDESCQHVSCFGAIERTVVDENGVAQKYWLRTTSWHIKTGAIADLDLDADTMRRRGARSSRLSSDGRWHARLVGGSLLVVDTEVAVSAGEVAYRESLAKPSVDWHEARATTALGNKDWYAATFNYAWCLTLEPDVCSYFENLRMAHGNLAKTSSAKNGTDKLHIPLIVAQALKLPRGEQMKVEADDHRQVKGKIWKLVKSPPESSKQPILTDDELAQMRYLAKVRNSEKSYVNPLCVAEFRMGNYVRAIEVGKHSLTLVNPSHGKPRPWVSELAVLSIAYWKQGEESEAVKHYRHLQNLMELEAEKNHPIATSFAKEANDFFRGKLQTDSESDSIETEAEEDEAGNEGSEGA